MSQIYYSAGTKGFYIKDMHSRIPDDAVEISSDDYTILLEGQSNGFVICPPDDEHDKPWLQAQGHEVRTLEEAKAEKLRQIDAETSAAILAGFDYEIDGEVLHFSYDSNDQQNFSDAQAMADMFLRGVPGVPESTSWNGWKIEKDENGVEVSRSLVRLDLDANAFLALFMKGAMMHKATIMEQGGQRKAQVDAATTLEELEGI